MVCNPADCPNGFCNTAGECVQELSNGAPCEGAGDVACQTGHCGNGFCCASGDCCGQASDCLPIYSSDSSCTDSSTNTDCQGTRHDATCVDFQCVSTIVQDDGGCSGMSRSCPNNLKPIVCTTAASQGVPVCPSGCTDVADCMTGFDCIGDACLIFDWTTLGPSYWPELQERLQTEAAKGNSAGPEAHLLTTTDSSAYSPGRYQGAVLAPDGQVYGVPRFAPHLIRLDPLTGLTQEGGPDFSPGAEWYNDKWYGSRLAHDGMIYAAPSDDARILRYAPTDFATAVPWGPVFPRAEDGSACTTSPDPGCNKWKGLAIVPSGRLIACPRTGLYVLEVDPSDSTGSSVRRVADPDIGTGLDKWWGAILAPNGRVYCIPLESPRILEIDPENLTDSGISLVGPEFTSAIYPELTSTHKWAGGALAPNGKIYAFPSGAPRVLQIDPTDFSTAGTKMVGPVVTPAVWAAWSSGALAPDGRIYVLPNEASGVLVIDPVLLDADPDSPSGVYSFEVTPSPLTLGAAMKFHGATLAPNGKIYAFPWFSATRVLEIDPHANGNFDMDVLLNGHLNGL